MVKPKKRTRKNRKRPIAVTIIVLLAIGEILLRLYWVIHYLLQTRIWVNGFPWPLWEAQAPTGAGLDLAAAAFRLLWLLVGIAVLIGLLRMKRWSWVMLVFWVSVSLSIGILHYFYRSTSVFNLSDYAVMAADMVLVFALNQSDIQRLYGIRRDDVEPIG
jgi:hypothetical protein